MPASDLLTEFARRMDEKSWGHWLTAVVMLVACFLAGPEIDQGVGIQRAEYALFQTMVGVMNRNEKPESVILVMVGDDEFWLGQPAGQTPINRAYLAGLLRLLESTHASVIALDVNLRSPDPRKILILPPSRSDTQALMSEIAKLAESHKVVLTKALWKNGSQYVTDPDIYQAYGICTRLDGKGGWTNPGAPGIVLAPKAAANISCGFPSLPFDERMIPTSVELDSGLRLSSFPLAIAAGKDPQAAAAAKDNAFGSYLPKHLWADASAVVPAANLQATLAADPTRFDGKIVIIGGNWHQLAWGRGIFNDMHPTPAGALPGAMMVGNFTEAILQKRSFAQTPEWLPEICELAFGAVAAVIFSIERRAERKLLIFLAVALAFILLQWLMLATLGMFFEALVPVFGLAIHSLAEDRFDHLSEMLGELRERFRR